MRASELVPNGAPGSGIVTRTARDRFDTKPLHHAAQLDHGAISLASTNMLTNPMKHGPDPEATSYSCLPNASPHNGLSALCLPESKSARQSAHSDTRDLNAAHHRSVVPVDTDVAVLVVSVRMATN